MFEEEHYLRHSRSVAQAGLGFGICHFLIYLLLVVIIIANSLKFLFSHRLKAKISLGDVAI
jgi:uncharacterized SAM-binding protein YcdF (DUF218 family)